MIRAKAQLVDKERIDALVVKIEFTATISELRALVQRVDDITQVAKVVTPWPLGDFIKVMRGVVTATVERVEEAQSVDV